MWYKVVVLVCITGLWYQTVILMKGGTAGGEWLSSLVVVVNE